MSRFQGATIRTFVALQLDCAALREFVLAQAPRERGLRWVAADNLHITLHFLGDVAPADLPEVFNAVNRAVRNIPSFDLALSGLGCFPEQGVPRVLWAGVGEGADSLCSLAAGLARELGPLGWPADKRPWHPHLTLARAVRGKSADVPALLSGQEDRDWGRLPVADVQVYMSRLRRRGAEHSVMHRARLA